jgi:hypothetical protein
MTSTFRRVAAVPLLALVAWLARAASDRAPAIRVSPSNPSAGQTVEVRDENSDADDLLPVFWTFGDGESARTPVASHRWSAPGTYAIELTGSATSGRIAVIVSPADTLRLNSAHPFEVTAQAEDPDTGRTSAGRAFAQGDRSGFFSFPDLTGDAESPEVEVKIVEAGWAGHYWVFWGSLTTLPFQLTVRDASTGQVRIYRKDSTAPDAGLDSGSFPFVPTPTPGSGSTYPTQDGDLIGERLPPQPAAPRPPGGRVVDRGPDSGTTRVPTVPNGSSPTRTRTPTKTKTPVLSATATPSPTITPTPTITLTPTVTPTPGPGFIVLQVVSWQWNFWFDPNGGPCALFTPYAPCTSVPRPNPPLTEITIHVNQPYQLYMCNRDSSDVTENHEFNGIAQPGLHIPDTILNQGDTKGPFLFTPTIVGDYTFSCKNTSCGTSEQHEGMIGVFHVVP